jgi:L-iditol 2-dehydrogenase
MRAMMHQAEIVSPERFAVRSVPRPELRYDGEILLRTAVCGICSGDLMPWYLARKVGTALGHEAVGWAAEVGSTVKHIRPGDLVFVHHHSPCGDCPECRRGAVVHCPTWRASGLDPGGMAEWIRVPTGIVRGDCFAIDLPPEEGLFIEPVGCSVKAMQRLGGRTALAGKRVAIVGCGIMGLLNIQTARAFGAAEVLAVEPDSARREVATCYGADSVLTPVEAESALARRMDVVVIGPGFPEVIRHSLGYVRDAGLACLFAPTPTGVLTSLDLGELYFREVKLAPSYSCGPEDTRLAYELLRTGKVRGSPLITHRFAIDDVQMAYDTARRGGQAIKVVVTFVPETSS